METDWERFRRIGVGIGIDGSCEESGRRPRKRARSRSAAAGLALLAAACSGGGGGDDPIPGGGTGLTVTPTTGLSTQGIEGGEFMDASQAYTLANTGSTTIEWCAEYSKPWIDVSEVKGFLAPGEETVVILAIQPDRARDVAAGRHSDTVSFLELQAGSGGPSSGNGQDLPVVVEVLGSGLEVTPNNRLHARGPAGGPFTPESHEYVVKNDTEEEVSWSATCLEGWLSLSTAGGVLAPGERETLVVSIDAAEASRLPMGSHVDTVFFHEEGLVLPVAVRGVKLDVTAPPSGGTASSLSQFGITWTFDQPYEVGQFANEDWWVVGPVTIVDIDPASTKAGERTVNGSMINPSPRDGWTQGYDSSMYAQYAQAGSYSASANVALGVSASQPLLVQPHSSLVSTISRDDEELRPQVETAAVLTVLGAAPPPGSFRPAYSGPDKTILFDESELDFSLLASLPKVPSTPDLAEVERWFERPWIDHVPDWIGRYTHPRENMPDYGREICDQVGTASLMLHLDFTDAEKRMLLIRLVQVGLDFHGIVQDGGEENWPAGGGHNSGRKWPILFAGLVLGDAEMQNIGFREVAFNEDDQTFYVEETSPGVYNYGQGGYTAAEVGMADWGGQHWKQIRRGQEPFFDDQSWLGDPYRLCCTANVWWGELLAARIMGAQALWNHDALFDYQDRFLDENRSRGFIQWRLAWSKFPYQMWNTYRAQF